MITLKGIPGFAGLIFYAPKRIFFGVTSWHLSELCRTCLQTLCSRQMVVMSCCNKLMQSLYWKPLVKLSEINDRKTRVRFCALVTVCY